MRKILIVLIAYFAFATRFQEIWSKMEAPQEYPETSYTFGTRNCGIGDINNDGYDDFLINRRIEGFLNGIDSTATNRVFLFLGGYPLDTIPDLEFVEYYDGVEFGGFGLVMNGLGDVNGDGYDDFAICAPHAVTDTMPWGEIAHGGRVFVYLGGPILDTFPDLIFQGNKRPFPPYWQGGSLASAVCGADVNGDGFNDIILGSADYSPTMNEYDQVRGRVYIYYGGSSIDTVPDLIINGGNYYAPFPARYEQLGFAIDNLGDVNGDGYDDIIVGAPNNMERGAAAGKLYVFYGGDPMDTIPDWWYYGEEFLQCLGEVVSDAGDFNGDGYKDILIEDYRYQENGRALVFYGGNIINTIPDWIVQGKNYSASGVDCINDINGDGYDDIIISNNFYKSYDAQVGRVLLFYGGTAPDVIPDICYTGRYGYEYNVGWNLCSAGDVDADGINEIIFGTNYPPIIPYPGVYGWVRVMKYCETALPEALSITGGDCYVIAYWHGRFEEETSHYQLLKNDIPDTVGWWQVGVITPNDTGFYKILDYDVEFSKSQYYWLKVYAKSGKYFIYGHYEAMPVPIDVKNFTAYWQLGEFVQLEWEAQGISILGYNVYRETNDIREKVNTSIISRNLNEYQDFSIVPNKKYCYWLGVLQTSQAERLIGPISPFGVVSVNPNPFRNQVKFGVRVSKWGIHSLKIFNILGQRVKTLWQDEIKEGYQEIVWDGTDDKNHKLSAGVYYCIYTMGSCKNTVKVILIK